MNANTTKTPAEAERRSDRELVVTRSFDAPAALVFQAWTTPELMKQWWAPKTFGLTMVACEMDVRSGGGYRLVYTHESEPSKEMPFFGKYLEVTPNARLVWTNEEGEDGAVTTVTFEEKGGKTLVVMHDLYPSKEALDEAIACGSTSGTGCTFDQLEELLASRKQPS